MKCYFGDKESCTGACKYYKTCIWSVYKREQEKKS